MRVFVDTEFTDLTANARLIAVGLVSEQRQSFYAELDDTYVHADCSDFVVANVLPHLEGGSCRMPLAELRHALADWLASIGLQIALAMDDGRDWHWIKVILADHWPANVMAEPEYLNLGYLNDADAFYAAVDAAFIAGARRHHALDDAKANRLGWFASEHREPPV